MNGYDRFCWVGIIRFFHREREIAIKEKELGINSQILIDTAILMNKDNSNNIQKGKIEVNLQPDGAAQGQVTFLQKGKTLFYIEESITENGVSYGEGNIFINGTPYKLKNTTYNRDNGAYTITGDNISIKTSACKYEETESEDCSYGTFSTITITLNSVSTVLKNIDLQDCPSFN